MSTDLHARWGERQEALGQLLRAFDAEDCDWRVDLARGAFWWQRPGDGAPVVVASAKLLASHARSDGSVLPSWLNRTVPESARVAPVAGLNPEGSYDEAGAWTIAMQIADAAGAHYLYRGPSAQLHVYLGLWDVRKASDADAPFAPGSPWPHAVDVIGTLGRTLDERPLDETRALLRNYGRDFASSHVHRGTPEEQPLRELGEALAALAAAPDAELRPGLVALMRQAEAKVTGPEDTLQ